MGMYGVVSYAVSQRTREIGVRMAMGASRTNVLALVLGNNLAALALGIPAGIALAVFLARGASRFLFGVGTSPIRLSSLRPLF
jgi:ABC-type antimicrobial peptide transport system permease subunit